MTSAGRMPRVTTVGGRGLSNLPTRGVFLSGRPVRHHPARSSLAEFGWGHEGSGPRDLAYALAHAARCPAEREDDYAAMLENEHISRWIGMSPN